jgi:small subunit ribosomal protein S9
MATKKTKKTEKTEKKPLPAVKKKSPEEIKEKKEVVVIKKFFYAVGRRKTSIAQVRIFEEKSNEENMSVNGKKAKEYFPSLPSQNIIFAPLKATGLQDKFGFSILVRGGGVSGQAGASQLGISRALVKYNDELRKSLRDLGFLTRDSRKVERKKPGLKKARRAPQWAKR